MSCSNPDDKKLTELASLDPLLGTDAIYAVRGGVSYQTTINAILASSLREESWSFDTSGVSGNMFNAVGEQRTVTSGEVGDYVTDFGVGNQHLVILVNTITAGGDIIITGTSVSESTAVPVADTETLTVDTTAAQRYQTSKKWLEVTNIDVSGTTTINYDVEVVGYVDFANRDFEIIGYRTDFRTGTGLADIAFVILKVQDDGGGKMSFVTVENMGFDSTAGNGEYIDGERTGGDDRSFTTNVRLAESQTSVVFKMLDFDTFFVADENIIEGTKDEGFIIQFQGAPSGAISGVDFSTVTLYYKVTSE